MLNIDSKGKVTPDPETLRVKGFKEIWDRDKSDNKDKALDIFAYIWFKYNPKSKYLQSSAGDELQERLLDEVIKNKKWKPPKYVVVAEQIYEKGMDTVGMKLLNSSLVAVEGVAALYLSVPELIKKIEDPAKKLDLASKVLGGLDKVDTVVLKIERAIKKVREEILEIKSNSKQIGRLELPINQRS